MALASEGHTGGNNFLLIHINLVIKNFKCDKSRDAIRPAEVEAVVNGDGDEVIIGKGRININNSGSTGI